MKRRLTVLEVIPIGISVVAVAIAFAAAKTSVDNNNATREIDLLRLQYERVVAIRQAAAATKTSSKHVLFTGFDPESWGENFASKLGSFVDADATLIYAVSTNKHLLAREYADAVVALVEEPEWEEANALVRAGGELDEELLSAFLVSIQAMADRSSEVVELSSSELERIGKRLGELMPEVVDPLK